LNTINKKHVSGNPGLFISTVTEISLANEISKCLPDINPRPPENIALEPQLPAVVQKFLTLGGRREKLGGEIREVPIALTL
jgi:hypothetical protein